MHCQGGSRDAQPIQSYGADRGSRYARRADPHQDHRLLLRDLRLERNRREGCPAQRHVTDWRRPGKEIGISATTNHAGTDLFYNFSTNSHPFEAGTVYTKFAAYTFLEHGEDFSAAASQLATEGYGTGDHGWPDYSDLPLLLPKAPPLEPDLLPEALRDWTTDVAERMQVPLEMVAVPLVIGLASVVGRRLGIHPKRHDDWLVVPNLYGAAKGNGHRVGR